MTSRYAKKWGASRDSAYDSFTLVELLVAMAVLSLLVFLLASTLNSVMRAWQQEVAFGERRSTARRALDTMGRDLGVAALPLCSTDTNSLQFVIDPPGPGMAPYLVPHGLFWQAPVAVQSGAAPNKSNLAVVGYFVRWVGTKARLCRLFINPTAGADYAIYTAPSSWVTPTLLDKYASASTTDSYAGMIGEDVLGLWAQALDGNGNPIVKTATGSTTAYSSGSYDSRLGYSVVSTSGGSSMTNSYGPSALPAAVRIGIVVADSRTAKLLGAPILPASPTTNLVQDINVFMASLPPAIGQGAEAYTEVVQLPRTPQ